MLLEARTFFTADNTYPNILATAWLTDPEVWSLYANSDAVFAIGSPTAELFAASYNNTGKSNTITLGLGTYGYTYNTSHDWLIPEYNHGIYNQSTSSYWWLASPNYLSISGLNVSGNGELNVSGNGELYVSGYGGCFLNGHVGRGHLLCGSPPSLYSNICIQ